MFSLPTTGSADATRTYYAYGNVRTSTGSIPTRRQFTDQYLDDTGLTYMNARYYDPALGAFISPDTIVPDAGNLFDYNRYMMVRGNPLKYSDPTGHFTDDAIQDYLKQTHGDLWEEYWDLWSADNAWMDMMYKAAAGDIFASISTDSGLLRWHQFSGEGVTSLTGASEINLNGGSTLFPEVMLDVLRPNSNRTIAGGLLRPGADNAFQVVATMPDPRSNLTLSLHNVGYVESLAKHGARMLGIASTSEVAVAGINKAGKSLGPIGSIAVGLVVDITVSSITDDYGFSPGDQQVTLSQLTINHRGQSVATSVHTWWWHPPQTGSFVSR